jgi:hypothetical protein
VFASYLGGDRRRSGTVMCIWNSGAGTSAEYTDTSTIDLGLSTSDIEFKVNNNAGVIELSSIVLAGTWDVKTGIRII